MKNTHFLHHSRKLKFISGPTSLATMLEYIQAKMMKANLAIQPFTQQTQEDKLKIDQNYALVAANQSTL
jgi:hypothetical protein